MGAQTYLIRGCIYGGIRTKLIVFANLEVHVHPLYTSSFTLGNKNLMDRIQSGEEHGGQSGGPSPRGPCGPQDSFDTS